MLISVKVDNGPSPIIVDIIDAKSPDEARMRAYNYVYYGDQFSTEEAADQDTLETYTSVVNPRELRDRRPHSSPPPPDSRLGESISTNTITDDIKRIARLIKEDIDDTAPDQNEHNGRSGSTGHTDRRSAVAAAQDALASDIALNPATERANKAASEASQWHQGSGIHADGLAAACYHFEELGHTEVAELLADAAEAEALHLKKTRGEWLDYDEWQKTASGMATQKAEAAAQKIDPTFRINDWV